MDSNEKSTENNRRWDENTIIFAGKENWERKNEKESGSLFFFCVPHSLSLNFLQKSNLSKQQFFLLIGYILQHCFYVEILFKKGVHTCIHILSTYISIKVH